MPGLPPSTPVAVRAAQTHHVHVPRDDLLGNLIQPRPEGLLPPSSARATSRASRWASDSSLHVFCAPFTCPSCTSRHRRALAVFEHLAASHHSISRPDGCAGRRAGICCDTWYCPHSIRIEYGCCRGFRAERDDSMIRISAESRHRSTEQVYRDAVCEHRPESC